MLWLNSIYPPLFAPKINNENKNFTVKKLTPF